MSRPLKILMIAPQPFFTPRGTPFSVYHRLLALSRLGHEVDLVTYPIGEDVTIPGLKISRFFFPFFRRVKIGPSGKKIVLDIFLMARTLERLLIGEYDLVHSHEEAAVWGVILAKLFRRPHLYDMHSSLPQQLVNFKFSRSRALIRLGEAVERFIIKWSQAVIVICPALEQTVAEIIKNWAVKPRVFLIENVAGGSKDLPEAEQKKIDDQVRQTWQPRLAGRKAVVYTGTFESYQGLDLLIEAAALLVERYQPAVFLLVGGSTAQVEYYQTKVRQLGLEKDLIFTGQRPAEEIPIFNQLADVLVSPRSTGTNTPLKIYSYLDSGRPIVATNIYTHTQVLDDSVAFLTEPQPEAMAEGIVRALTDQAAAQTKVQAAKKLYQEKYSYDIYLAKTGKLIEAAASGQTEKE